MITIGTTYKTRTGMSVTIEHDKGDDFYPFFGKIMQADGLVNRIAYFTFDGKYVRGEVSDFDLLDVL